MKLATNRIIIARHESHGIVKLKVLKNNNKLLEIILLIHSINAWQIKFKTLSLYLLRSFDLNLTP